MNRKGAEKGGRLKGVRPVRVLAFLKDLVGTLSSGEDVDSSGGDASASRVSLKNRMAAGSTDTISPGASRVFAF